jgi:predicted AAA+ superfamily ATPase
MPHQRARHLDSLLRKTISYSGITGVFGHRQVGKTTLVCGISANYSTLDDPLRLARAESDPAHFIQEGVEKGLFVIDECQLAPPLFPALKEWVRTHPKPGQLVLTGSVRFSSRKLIRESLTGRLIAWELLPMDLSEAHELKLPDKIPRLLKADSIEVPLLHSPHVNKVSVAKALSHGGLPGIFSVRDPAIRAQRFDTMINTVLERDLRLIVDTSLGYSSLLNLLKSLAIDQGQPLAWASLARKTRISVPTLKKLVQAFESIFLIRVIQTEGSERRSVVMFEDQGEATHLSSNRYDDLTQLTRFLYSELRHQIHYRPELNGQIFQFRNRGGASVPICFRAGRNVLGIVPTLTENLEPGALATARSFLKTYPGSKILYVHSGSQDQVIDSRTRVLGAAHLL